MRVEEKFEGSDGLPELHEVSRLSPGERDEAITDFALYRLGDSATDDEWDDFVAGCEVVYSDDLETGESRYQVRDARGHGDGTGEWHPVGEAE